ncbi:MAG: glycosyltransferase family A protein [Proteobacteria bacterium]|nr:glycosyltransferase family A protein [Pseudomonadota bacterium]
MLVSAVIPTYNRAKDVVIAVECVLAQTYKNIEILVCDDGSKDNTAEVLAPYRDRIRYLPKPNGGVSSARNWGIEHAKGEIVALLDSDDEWLPTKIAAQMEVMTARPEIGMVLTGFVRMTEERVDVPGTVTTRRVEYPRDGWILSEVIRVPALCPSTVMIRTAIARAIGGFDTTLRTAEDLDFHLRVAREYQIAVVPTTLMRYMENPQGLGSEMRTYRDYVFVVERFLDTLAPGEVGKQDLREAYIRMYLKNALGLAYHGDVKAAAQLGVKALPFVRNPGEARTLARLGALVGRNFYDVVAQAARKRVSR